MKFFEDNLTPVPVYHLLSILDLRREDIEAFIQLALDIKTKGTVNRFQHLKGKIIATAFFEASTRTRLSFEAAAYRQGAQVIGFSDVSVTSSGQKGESLEDNIRVLSQYADGIVLRHPKVGAAELAAHVSNVPIINAGDGDNQHPSQTLLDLMTIYEHHNTLDGLRILCCGDLKYGRTIHSLIQALSLFEGCHFVFYPTAGLDLPAVYLEGLMKAASRTNVTFSYVSDFQNGLVDCDVVYLTRLQVERFEKAEASSLVMTGVKAGIRPNILSVDLIMNHLSEEAIILHPLPRQEELPLEVDVLKQAKYFEQVKNGLYMREAILVRCYGSE